MKSWPELQFEQYRSTAALVHLWTQVVGKIRLVKTPWINHSWHVSLYLTPNGFSTSSIPYTNGIFEIQFNFAQHRLEIVTSEGGSAHIDLASNPVSHFHNELFHHMTKLGIQVRIHGAPNEMDPAIPFADDHRGQEYHPEEMKNLWQAFISVHNVFVQFRSRFIGKCSPVHLFWGAFDLAVTRFSGRTAPKHPGGMPNMPLQVMQEAYSHEVSSAGFWPGNDQSPQPVFYSYCYPVAPSFGEQKVKPAEAFFSPEMGEFFLPYQAVQSATDPDATLMDFLQSTYQAGAETAKWDRESLEFDFSTYPKGNFGQV